MDLGGNIKVKEQRTVLCKRALVATHRDMIHAVFPLFKFSRERMSIYSLLLFPNVNMFELVLFNCRFQRNVFNNSFTNVNWIKNYLLNKMSIIIT